MHSRSRCNLLLTLVFLVFCVAKSCVARLNKSISIASRVFVSFWWCSYSFINILDVRLIFKSRSNSFICNSNKHCWLIEILVISIFMNFDLLIVYMCIIRCFMSFKKYNGWKVCEQENYKLVVLTEWKNFRTPAFTIGSKILYEKRGAKLLSDMAGIRAESNWQTKMNDWINRAHVYFWATICFLPFVRRCPIETSSSFHTQRSDRSQWSSELEYSCHFWLHLFKRRNCYLRTTVKCSRANSFL